MLSKLQLDHFCFYWMALAGITFISLLFINAPYGKYIKSNWGPTISNKIGWIIMESISPLCFSYFFWTGMLPKNLSLVLIYLLWVLHYCYRSFIFPLKTQTATKKMPIAIVLMATFFNCINGFTNGYYLGNFADDIQPSYFFQLPIIFGFILFFAGFYIHFTADNNLIQLRKLNGPGYHIPKGFLFNYLSSPNYFGEIIQWIGFAFICGGLPSITFAIWTMANLIPRAIANHKWYHVTFSDYPQNRKSILPFIY